MKITIEIDTSTTEMDEFTEDLLDGVLNNYGLTTISLTQLNELHNKADMLVKQPETIVEAPKEEKTTPTKAEPKKETVAAKKAPVKTKIDLATLKESAKNAVSRSSREEVKKTIGLFADKLAEVNTVDYATLHEQLEVLGK